GIKGSFARQGKDERAEYCRSSSFRWGFPSGALRAIATGRLDKMRRKSHSRPSSAERLDKRVIECRVIKGRAIEGPGAGRGGPPPPLGRPRPTPTSREQEQPRAQSHDP